MSVSSPVTCSIQEPMRCLRKTDLFIPFQLPSDSYDIDNCRRAARFRDWFMVFAQTLNVKLNRRTDLADYLCLGSAGGDTPRQVVAQLAGNGHGSWLSGCRY